MIQIIIMLVTGILWLLQGYVFGYQFPFVDDKPVLIVLGQVTQGLSTIGGTVYVVSSLFLMYEKFIRNKESEEKFEVDLFYNIMTIVGVVLLICTTL